MTKRITRAVSVCLKYARETFARFVVHLATRRSASLWRTVNLVRHYANTDREALRKAQVG
jgi:hypothetical protein